MFFKKLWIDKSDRGTRAHIRKIVIC